MAHPEFLQSVSVVAGVGHSIEQIRAGLDDLTRRAFISDLTGLLNRAAFKEIAEIADRSYGGGAIAFIDLTGFKAINDSHGMVAGDVCITEAGRRLAAMMTGGSLPFHVSGDEFLVLLHPDNQDKFSGDFESQVAAFTVMWDENELAVKASAGIALPDGTATLEQLRKRAEKACKYAKWFGNNVIVWTYDVESKLPGERRWRCDKCHAQVSVVADGITKESDLKCPACLLCEPLAVDDR